MGRPNVNVYVGGAKSNTIYKNKVLKNGVPFNLQVTDEDTRYVIKWDYDLDGAIQNIPLNCILDFQGGTLSNGTIVGNHTGIVASSEDEIFEEGIVIEGTWEVDNIYDGWFKYNYIPNTANNQIIKNILTLTNDERSSNVYIVKNRTYLVELPTIPLSLKGGVDQSVRQYNRSVDVPDGYTRPITHGDLWEALCIFSLSSNTRYIIDSTIQMLPTAEDYYYLFRIFGKENITIEGRGSIIGDNTGIENTHDYYKYYNEGATYFGEQGFILRAWSVKNLLIKDLTFSGSFGDNIYITGNNIDRETGEYYSDTEITYSDTVRLLNVKIKYARRNGIAVSARNVIVSNCHFEGNGIAEINGTAPKAGIDFECDQGSASLNAGPGAAIMCNRNVLMDACVFKDNENDISSTANRVYGETTIETYIKNCSFTSPLRLNKTAGIQFEDCYFPIISGKLSSLWYIAASEYINFIRCVFEDSNIRMTSYTSSDGKYNVSDSVKFIDCVYFNTFKIADTAFLYASAAKMVYLRVKKPPTNSDAFVEIKTTFAGSINGTTCLCYSKFGLRLTSSTHYSYMNKLISARGTAFDVVKDDHNCAPKIAVEEIDGYWYIFICNENFGAYNLGIDYTINCCKITNSASETQFVRIDLSPAAGVFEETEEISRATLTYKNPLNHVYVGNYMNNASIYTTPRVPYTYNGRLLVPDGSYVKDAMGEKYDIPHKGPTSSRPTPTNPGFMYLDETLGKPIWWDGSKYIDATGTTV